VLTSKPPSSSSSKVADAFAGDIAARLLPLNGFAKTHCFLMPKLFKLPSLARNTYDVLVARHDNWKEGENRPLTRTEDLAELFDRTPRNVQLAIALLIDEGLVRRRTPARANGGHDYEIVQPGELVCPVRIDRQRSMRHVDAWKADDRSDQSRIDRPASMRAESTTSVPDLPPTLPDQRASARDEGGGELGILSDLPNSWVEIARRLFPDCHSPQKFLRVLLERGLDEPTGRAYLERAEKATDLPHEDVRALSAWCSSERVAQYFARRKRARAELAKAASPELAPELPTPAEREANFRRARERFGTVGVRVYQMPDPTERTDARLGNDTTRGDTETPKVALHRSSPEETANLEGGLDIAEGGSR